GEIHDDDVGVKLWRGIARFVIWPRRSVFELSGDHLAGSDRWFVSTASGLDIALEYFQGFLHTLPVCHSCSLVVANQSGKRNRFRRAESRVPTGAVFARRNLFAVVVDCLTRRHKPNELFASVRVLTCD